MVKVIHDKVSPHYYRLNDWHEYTLTTNAVRCCADLWEKETFENRFWHMEVIRNYSYSNKHIQLNKW